LFRKKEEEQERNGWERRGRAGAEGGVGTSL